MDKELHHTTSLSSQVFIYFLEFRLVSDALDAGGQVSGTPVCSATSAFGRVADLLGTVPHLGTDRCYKHDMGR